MVAGHRHQPADRAVAPHDVSIGALPDLDIDVLQRLLGFRPVSQDTQCHTEKFRTGAPVEVAEGVPVAQCHPGDQVGDVGRVRGHEQTLATRRPAA
jgi:hypothetical protein